MAGHDVLGAADVGGVGAAGSVQGVGAAGLHGPGMAGGHKGLGMSSRRIRYIYCGSQCHLYGYFSG